MKRTMIIITAGTLVLAVIFMLALTSNETKNQSEECELAEIQAIETEPTCYQNNTLQINIKNTGLSTITGIKLYLEAAYNLSITLEEEIKPGAPIRKELGFGKQDMGAMKKLTIRPIVTKGGQQEVCAEKRIEIQLTRCG